MSTRNKKAGKLPHSDLNVTSGFCWHVGKLCWCWLQLGDMAAVCAPPEASKASSSSPVHSSHCFGSALLLCAQCSSGGLGAAWSWTRAAGAQIGAHSCLL